MEPLTIGPSRSPRGQSFSCPIALGAWTCIAVLKLAEKMTSNDSAPARPEARDLMRSSMFLGAVLRVGNEQAPVKVRNMSPHGAMVESPIMPPPGTEVQLVRGSLYALGTVVWVSTDRCGLRFSSELCVKEWLAVPAKDHQQRVDHAFALAKAGAFRNAATATCFNETLDARSSVEQIVDDLQSVLSLLQALEDDLATSGETLARHGSKLQNIDIAMQMIRAVAKELQPDQGGLPTSLARLQDLRISCAQALGRP